MANNKKGNYLTIKESRQIIKHNIKKIIFISSNCLWARNFDAPVTEEETPFPVEIYGKSKLEAEKILLSYKNKINSIIFRSPTIMDEGRLGLLGILFEFIDEGRKLPMVGDGKNRYQFIYAKDLVKAFELALSYNKTEIFNIGSDNVKTFNEVYEYVIKKSGSNSRLIHFPKLPMIWAMKICFWLGISPLGPYQYKMIASSFVFDTNKIKQKLGFSPSLKNEEMLLRAYEFYHKNKKEILITDYLVSAFNYFDIIMPEGTYFDYLNKSIDLSVYKDYKIVGIIDTNFEKYTHFSKTEIIDSSSKLNYAFFNEYKMMNTLYLNPDDFLLESSIMSNKIDLSEVSFEISLKGRAESAINNHVVLTEGLDVKSVITDQKDENGVHISRNIGRAVNHDAYEIIVPYSVLVDLYNLTSREPTSYGEYYRSWNRLNKNITLSVTDNNGNVEKLDVTIVGVTQLNGKNIGVSKKVMEFLFNQLSNSSYLLAEVSPFESDAYEQFEQAYEEGYLLDLFAYRSDIDSYEISPFVNLLSKAGLFVFAVFTIGILWTIISLDIVDQKKEIGTFRSIGLSGMRVSLIFIFQTAVICIISYIIALIAGNYAIQLFDSTIHDSENLIHLSMFMMTYRSPVLLIVFLLVITSLALFLPLYKIMSQKIIDVINERGEL